MSDNVRRITKQEMEDKVYAWGVKNWRLPVFKTDDEEISHFGKRICEFDDIERKHYSTYMTQLEYLFEVGMAAHLGL